jgi:hypothetical protein
MDHPDVGFKQTTAATANDEPRSFIARRRPVGKKGPGYLTNGKGADL